MMKKLFTSLLLGVSLICGVNAAENNGPVLHLKLDEGTGNIAKDFSGNGLDAALRNIAWEEFGVQGKAVRFNGKDSAIVLPISEKLNPDKAMTLSVWIKAEKSKVGMSLFNRGNYRLAWSTYIFRSFIAFSSLKMKGAVCYTRVPPGTDKLSPWHHIVFTLEPDPADGKKLILRFYLDGKLLKDSKTRLSDRPVNAPIADHPKVRLTLGNFASAESQWFNGLMDEVKIYDRALSAEEVAKEYKENATQRAEVPAKQTVLKKIDFGPLKNTRIAVYEPLPGKWAVPVQSPAWFKEQAEKLGCRVTLLDDTALGNKTLVQKKNYDTLILPAGVIPFEAEDSVFAFLASGGNLLIPTVLPSVYKRNADGTFGKFNGRILKNHNRGWYAPFLLRDNPAAQANRKWISPLGLNPEAVNLTGDLLPAACGPFPKLFYRPLDAWNKQPGLDGSYGDGTNYAQGADLKFDLYLERNGIPSDFTVYRYYNNLLYGATLVNLGRVGSLLLKGRDGDKVFHAVLRLMESRLPGEQAPEYYRTATALHKEWSELGFVYSEAVAALRDAAYFRQLLGGEWKYFRDDLNQMEKEYSALALERKAQQSLLVSGKYAVSAKASAALLKKVRDAAARYAALSVRAKETFRDVKAPAKVPVRHKYGTIPSIASFTVPVNLSRMRGRLFGNIRRIGSNVFSSQPFPEWYADDPVVREQLSGILRDHKFIYSASARYLTGGGRFNPANGTVKDGKAVPYPEKVISNQLKAIFENWKWKGKEQFRIGSADETGLGLNFWGTPAKEALQKHLREYYKNDIAAMNEQCGTAFKSFEEVAVPVRQPETPAQHAVWEHFRRCREALLESFYSRFYGLVRKYNPDIDIFQLPSTGGSLLPLYGLNYYNATRYQDVSGIDGTCCAIDQEWLYSDLTMKRYLTSEWGALYQEVSPQRVHGQMWQELGAGALGVEQHIWSFGNDSCNFADTLDIPTIYGALLHTTLKEMRKLDHLILDGERAVPEIGILFSQTARMHDQGWGWAGSSTFSAHLHTVSVYYKHFLQYGRSARVFAEEALLEGKMPSVKVLIVPQAEFLSAAVQKKLLDYVRNGGRLIIEGNAGRFDEFGRKSNLIFMETAVIPGFVSASEAVMEKSRIGLLKKDTVFSPGGEGKVLAAYPGGAPAILTRSCGKGSVTFIGFGAGLHKYTAFAPVLERVLRSLGIGERFKVSDPDVVLREWTHSTGTYLLLTSQKGKQGRDWGLEETEVRIRGKVSVEDYLFGKDVKTQYKDGYTVFRTLTANGCRVFRIKGGIALAETPLSDSVAFKLENSSGTRDDVKKITLPYKGRLYADSPLKAGKWTFSATILGSGNNARVGTAYLTVSSGNEDQKKRIEAGKTVWFRTRDKIFEVKCLDIFFMYPFHTTLEIREVKAVPYSGKAAAVKKKELITLSNDLISLTFDSGKGGSLISFLPLAEKENLIANNHAWTISGQMPGPFHSARMPVEIKQDGNAVSAEFAMTVPVQNKLLVQKASLLPDAAVCDLTLSCINRGSDAAKFDLRYHPELHVGGSADSSDEFFIAGKDGSVIRSAFRGQNSGKQFRNCGSWAAIVDTRSKCALINTFRPDEVERIYIWEASDFYTLEMFSPRKTVEPGKSIDLNMRFLYLHGLSGVGAVSGLNAAYLVLPETVDQSAFPDAVVEAATAALMPDKVLLEAALFDGKRKIASFRKAEDSFAFDLPSAFVLQPETDLKAFPDGCYTIQVNLTSPSGNLSFTRKVTFAGQQLKLLAGECAAFDRKLAGAGKKLSAAGRFACQVKIGELKRALSGRDLPVAQRLADELKNELK